MLPTRLCAFLLVFSLAILTSRPGFSAERDQIFLDDPSLTRQLAQTLFEGLDRTTTTGQPRLALAPLDPGSTGLDPDILRQLEAALTNALVRYNPGSYRITSRADIEALVTEISDFDSNKGETESRRLTRLFREAGGDYLLTLQFAQGLKGNLQLFLRAVSVDTGHILAVATIDNIGWRRAVSTQLHSPESAAHAAARDIVASLPELAVIAPSALYYANSGFQGHFGTWWQPVLNAAITEYWNRHYKGNSKQLLFQRYHPKDFLTPPPPIKQSAPVTENGITWQPTEKPDTRPFSEDIHKNTDPVYHLSGKYWDLGDEVDIQLQLRNRSGHIHTWRGRINRADIAISLSPGDTSLARPRLTDDLGPVNLRLTSNHGNNPVLHIRDRFSMQVTVDRPSWLTCYYQQADSAVMRIYPTKHDVKNRIGNHDIVSIPPRTAGYAFQVTAPVGTELVKCFATDRDVSDLLPAVLKGPDFTPLPVGHMNDVVAAWRKLRQPALSEASMAVTVLP